MFRNFQTPPPPPPPPPTKPKGKIKVSTIIPAVIIVACLIGALYFTGAFDSLIAPSNSNGNSGNNGGVLSPTRNIIGTWKTSFPTEFLVATDYDDFSTLKDVGTQNRTMTWTIRSTTDENVVNVDVEFAVTSQSIAAGSGYVPDVSPMSCTGIINGTQLTLTKEGTGGIDQIGTVGVFTFTTDLVQGTWHDHWEGVWGQNVYTPTNGLKLIKQ
jgi:hypothetical protein